MIYLIGEIFMHSQDITKFEGDLCLLREANAKKYIRLNYGENTSRFNYGELIWH